MASIFPPYPCLELRGNEILAEFAPNFFKPPQCSRNAYLSESSSLSAQSILILYDNCIRKREKQEFNYCALVMISFLLAQDTVDLYLIFENNTHETNLSS